MTGVTPASGAISFLDLQNVFGGTNPIDISEYYTNANPLLTNGVAGIPSIGYSISLNQFYGKSKSAPPPASSYPPASVQSNYNNFGSPWPLASTSLEWVAGASGVNLTIVGGSTFNNLGADFYANRPNFINYQNLILQGRPGDTLQFQVRNGAAYSSDPEVNSLLLHLGAGWFAVGSIRANGSHTATFNYVVPMGTLPGNYGILAFNNYSSAANGSYASANFYSLHISN